MIAENWSGYEAAVFVVSIGLLLYLFFMGAQGENIFKPFKKTKKK